MSEEHVLEDQVVLAAEDLAESREEEAGKFEHPHGIVDPVARVCRPTNATEMGDAAVFLLSDRAAYLTSEIVFVDGGGTDFNESVAR